MAVAMTSSAAVDTSIVTTVYHLCIIPVNNNQKSLKLMAGINDTAENCSPMLTTPSITFFTCVVDSDTGNKTVLPISISLPTPENEKKQKIQSISVKCTCKKYFKKLYSSSFLFYR
jgi:hypothetical protein